MSKKKKIILICSVILVILIVLIVGFLVLNKNRTHDEIIDTDITELKELPKPEISGGARGELGIDKNINESTIDEYLNRPDSVYRDMRMLEDPANYENIGGDRFLSGYIKGFEVIPLPYIIPVTGLPSEVGDTYTGTTLFYSDEDGRYIANYEESMKIIEEIFPKDKVIFLMCGGGGYAGMTKNFLISMGWDENKIYNIGGHWYYKGENNIEVKKEVNGVVSYDFENVPYHNIDFEKLTKTSNYKDTNIKVEELKINTSEIALEEGTSFKLNVIILPNEATNREVKWSSSDKSIATVDDEGLVKAVKNGNATITVESIDENITASCEVVVYKRQVSEHIKLDNISKEIAQLKVYDFDKIEDEFYNTVHDSNGELKEQYYTITEQGYMDFNDLWEEEHRKYEEKVEQAINNKVDILNSMLDDKKTFIVLAYSDTCGDEYSIAEGGKAVLKKNNYQYIDFTIDGSNGNAVIERSKLFNEDDFISAITIVKDGKIYTNVDLDVDSIKDDEETKNWLSKYIDIKK